MTTPLASGKSNANPWRSNRLQRQGAGAVYLNAHHPDIMRALDTKRENADEKVRIKTLSLGVIIPDVTFELAKKNADMYLFSPYDVERVEGKPFADLSVTEHYHAWVEDDRITKTKINARQFFQTLSELQFESGYPYCLFEDTANADHTMGHAGRVQMSNLCVAPETQLLTDTGYHQIKDLAEQWVNAWNGEEFSRSYVAKTGENQKLLTVDFDNGASIDATEYHKFYVKTGYGNRKVVEKRTHELQPGDQLEDYELPDGTKCSVSVTSVTDHGRVGDTYCLNEPKLHKVIFNGVRTGQCSEILQVNTPSEFGEAGEYSEVGQDISCNLGSMNIAAAMANPSQLPVAVATAVDALTSVVHESNIKAVPPIVKANQLKRSIGLGQMNLHGFLAQNKIHYGSEESIEFVHAYFSLVRYHALKRSCELAKEHGPFETYYSSKYDTGEALEKYKGNDYRPTSPRIKDLFDGVVVPGPHEWAVLADEIEMFGLYHSYLLAVPPTGNISYVNGSTPSIHPVTGPVEIRKEGKMGRVYYPAPGLSRETLPYYTDAYSVGYEKLIDVYAAATEHTDQGLSLTLFLPSTATTRDLNKAQIYAWRKGIKTMYYLRTRQEALEGTGVDTCLSCSL